MPYAVAEGEPNIYCWEVTLHYTPRCYTHTHTFHELIIGVGGNGTQLTGHGVQPMREGDLFFFPAGQHHNGNGGIDSPCATIVLYLRDEAFSPALDGEQGAELILRYLCETTHEGANLLPLSPAGRERMRTLFRRMATEFREKAPGYKCAVTVSLQQIMLTILRDPSMPAEILRTFKPAGRHERLADVYQFLQTHFRQHVSVEQVLEIAHLSRSQFHTVFKADTGQTLTQYLNALRLTAAATMLRTTDQPIAHISYQCGFPCLSHFYALFHEAYGLSPSIMRRQSGEAVISGMIT